MKRDPDQLRPAPEHVLLVGFILIALIIGGKLAWALAVHGDWRCAFAQCRIETK